MTEASTGFRWLTDREHYMIPATLSEAREQGIRMSEVAEILKSSVSKLSHAVRKLEGAGWIRRDADPEGLLRPTPRP